MCEYFLKTFIQSWDWFELPSHHRKWFLKEIISFKSVIILFSEPYDENGDYINAKRKIKCTCNPILANSKQQSGSTSSNANDNSAGCIESVCNFCRENGRSNDDNNKTALKGINAQDGETDQLIQTSNTDQPTSAGNNERDMRGVVVQTDSNRNATTASNDEPSISAPNSDKDINVGCCDKIYNYLLCIDTKDKHIFSLLCYENFANLEHFSYILCAFRLLECPRGEGNSEPILEGILKLWSNEKNFSKRHLVKQYVENLIIGLTCSLIFFGLFGVIFVYYAILASGSSAYRYVADKLW